MSKNIIITTTTAFIAGCFAAHAITVDILYVAYSIPALSATAILLRKNKKATLLCICCIVVLLGYIRIALPSEQTNDLLTEQHGKQVYIEGVIKGDIEDKKTQSRYTVEVNTVDGVPTTKKEMILVYEPYPTRCVSGEAVLLKTTPIEPKDFITKTGRVFGYKKYLQQRNIHAVSYIQKSGCTGKREQFALFERIRKKLVKAMHTFLPTEEATLLGGLLLGLRGLFSAEMLEAFRTTGLIHIIVLSGYNVTLVAEAVRRLLARTSPPIRVAASLLVIVLFVLLAGAQTAAVRAGSMATIALIARTTHREYDGIRALLLVAAIMVLINPNQVLFSTSFHLSFLATLGLLLLTPAIEQKIKKIPQKFEIRGIVAATIATQIAILPYLAYTIGEVSTVGIIANILVLPLIPPAMLFGTIITLIALPAPALAIALSPTAFLPLKTITTLAEILAKTPHATIPLPEIGVLTMLIATTAITLIGYQQSKKSKSVKNL